MSMGYGANYADVIEDKDVEAICPVAHRAFMVTLAANNTDLDDFACLLSGDDAPEEVIPAYNLLCEEFNAKTGLELMLEYHGSDDGDRYDDVTGGFWSIWGMYELTEAGKKLDNLVERKFYVTYG